MLMATRKLFSTLDYLNAKVPKVMQAESKINFASYVGNSNLITHCIQHRAKIDI